MAKQNLPPRAQAEKRYEEARMNLLLMLGLTLVNLGMLVAKTGTFLVFSATVPYYAVAIGAATGIAGWIVIGVAVCVVSLVLYLLCFLLGKKNTAWMTAALIFFILDTVAMAALFILAEDASGILDALGHAWVLYYLVVGVINANKLKTLPPDEEVPAEEVPQPLDE